MFKIPQLIKNIFLGRLTIFNKPNNMNANSLTTIKPYKWNNTQWVFDDKSTGLNKEAFVAGIDDILDKCASELKATPEKGLTVTFAAVPFPGHNLVLKHLTQDGYQVGNWYEAITSTFNVKGRSGWLCPALFLYFPTAPKHIYAKITK